MLARNAARLETLIPPLPAPTLADRLMQIGRSTYLAHDRIADLAEAVGLMCDSIDSQGALPA